MDEYIKRETALELFEEWIEATGALPKGTSYYYECRGCIEDAPAEEVYKLPCKIGDEVFCLRNRNGKRWEIFRGTVTQMYFVEDMRIGIYAKGGSRGEWGKEFFATREEAEAALEEKTLLLKRKKEKNGHV